MLRGVEEPNDEPLLKDMMPNKIKNETSIESNDDGVVVKGPRRAGFLTTNQQPCNCLTAADERVTHIDRKLRKDLFNLRYFTISYPHETEAPLKECLLNSNEKVIFYILNTINMSLFIMQYPIHTMLIPKLPSLSECHTLTFYFYTSTFGFFLAGA